MSGVLYYSDVSDERRLKGLTLPDLRNPAFDPSAGVPPKLRSCRFSLSRDGQGVFPDEAEWSPQGGMYAREDDNKIELGSSASQQTLHVPGSAPAFKPDGTFTYNRENRLVRRQPLHHPRSERRSGHFANDPAGASRDLVSGRAVEGCRARALGLRLPHEYE